MQFVLFLNILFDSQPPTLGWTLGVDNLGKIHILILFNFFIFYFILFYLISDQFALTIVLPRNPLSSDLSEIMNSLYGSIFPPLCGKFFCMAHNERIIIAANPHSEGWFFLPHPRFLSFLIVFFLCPRKRHLHRVFSFNLI